ncbi:MAG: AIR synthase-related protein [Phycisphaerales bacterium]
MLDVVLRARDWGSDGATERRSDGGLRDAGPAAPLPPSLRRSVASSLFSAITDCGAGGFSSAVGEMGADLGATVHLERAPLKYEGLSPTEIWISEAQERMVLAVPAGNVEALAAICREEGSRADLGEFGHPDGDLVLLYHGTEVGRLSMHFLHEGIPTPTREAVWGSDAATERRSDGGKGETAGQRSSATGPESRSPSSLRRCVAPSLLALLPPPTSPASTGSSASTTTRCRGGRW